MNLARTEPDCCTGYSPMQKGPVSKDTSPVRFSCEESAVSPTEKSRFPQTQLAEGFEPPTL